MDAHGTRFALLVGPNSGYGLDNRCMLDAIARSGGRFKGIAVVTNRIARAELEALKAAGIVGVAWNVTHYGVDYYANAASLLDQLEALDLFVQIQVEHDQLVPLATDAATLGRAHPDRPLRTADASGRHRPAGLQGIARARHDPARRGETLRLCEVLGYAVPASGRTAFH